MADPVDRQAAVSCISDLLMLELKGKRLPTYNEVYRAIYNLPSAQPERKKGLWVVETETDIKSGTNAISGYKCNKCGYFVPWDYVHKGPFYIEEYKFCPSCGKKMG